MTICICFSGWDVLLGTVCIASILILKALAPLLKLDRFRNKQTGMGWKILREIIKILCYGEIAQLGTIQRPAQARFF